MTTAERNIADRLMGITPYVARDRVFIAQLPNWYTRDMTESGKAKMLRLLEKFQQRIPDYHVLRSAYINEQLSKLAP